MPVVSFEHGRSQSPVALPFEWVKFDGKKVGVIVHNLTGISNPVRIPMHYSFHYVSEKELDFDNLPHPLWTKGSLATLRDWILVSQSGQSIPPALMFNEYHRQTTCPHYITHRIERWDQKQPIGFILHLPTGENRWKFYKTKHRRSLTHIQLDLPVMECGEFAELKRMIEYWYKHHASFHSLFPPGDVDMGVPRQPHHTTQVFDNVTQQRLGYIYLKPTEKPGVNHYKFVELPHTEQRHAESDIRSAPVRYSSTSLPRLREILCLHAIQLRKQNVQQKCPV